MQSYGRTMAGVPRWYCPICRSSRTRQRPDTRARHRSTVFLAWLLGDLTVAQLLRRYHVNRRTLDRWFAAAWTAPPVPMVPVSLAGQVLIVDGVYLRQDACILIARTPSGVVSWMFCDRESTATWLEFLATLPRPWAVVSDGQKGLKKAIRTIWPGLLQQRCLFHVMDGALTKLTQRPTTVAGQVLRRLVLALRRVQPESGRRGWFRRYRRWERQYEAFLKERSHGRRPDRKRSWWYTHQSLRSVRHLLRTAIPELFTYVDHPTISRTTNHVEGGVNSPLKDLIHQHRGLPLTKQQALAAYFLASKQR